jgi:hypothetical protein
MPIAKLGSHEAVLVVRGDVAIPGTLNGYLPYTQEILEHTA